MTVADINSLPDFNEYAPQDLSDLTTGLVGEGMRQWAMLWIVLISLVIFVLVAIIIYHIIVTMRQGT